MASHESEYLPGSEGGRNLGQITRMKMCQKFVRSSAEVAIHSLQSLHYHNWSWCCDIRLEICVHLCLHVWVCLHVSEFVCLGVSVSAFVCLCVCVSACVHYMLDVTRTLVITPSRQALLSHGLTVFFLYHRQTPSDRH